MFRILFLGTSGSTPTKERSMPSIAVERNGEVFLFDCGEGAQRQALRYSLNLSKIRAIFISHAHGDHIIGIAGLVRTLAMNKRQSPLHIFVPKGEERYIESLVSFDRAIINYGIIIKGIKPGKVYSERGFSVSAFALKHSVPTYGYKFGDEDKVRFIKEKCKKLGIKGEMFKELLKTGSITIKGKKIPIKSVTYEVSGKNVVYATDTRPTQSTINASRGVEMLIHETSYLHEHQHLAKERFHSTVKEAAIIAKKAGCKKLVLFHMSARYKDAKPLLNEARKTFKNTIVAEDGMSIEV